MTAARQKKKPQDAPSGLGIGFRAGIATSALAALVLGVSLAPAPISAATTERVVADYHTGLAIGGFDPVAYFVDSKPMLGRPNVELRFAGATWRFRNAGNRAAFAADPEVYMPRFGGYDPVAVARGASAPGHPELWLVDRQQLYLFYREEDRTAFVRDREQVLEMAERRWPDVLRTLVP
jgi:hypothetical protein